MDISNRFARPLFLGLLIAALVAGPFIVWAGEDPASPGPMPPPRSAPPLSVAPPEGSEGGIVNAASLRPFPKDTAVSVRAWDNSEINAELVRDIEEQLRQRGFTVASGAPLVLKFSTADSVGQWSSGPERRLVELSGRAGTGTEEEAQVRLNLFSTDNGGVFNERRATPETKTVSTYSLEMTIDRQDGQRIWQGEATTSATHSDRRQLGKQLIPVLLDNIGKTARSQPFGVK